MSSRRQPKAGGPSTRNTATVSDSHDDQGEVQDLAAQERQLDSDYDDAREESSIRTMQEQVQTLSRNQSQTETILQQLLTRITELSDTVRTPSEVRERQPTTPIRTRVTDTPDTTISNPGPSQRYSKKLPDPVPFSNGTDPTFLS